IYLLTQGILNGSGYITLYTGPVVSLIGDYRVTRRSSIGLGVAYQATNGTPGEGDDNPSPNESLREYITRTNVALRYMYQFSKSPYFDFYIGGRVGASFWTDNVGGLPNYGTLAMGHSFSVLPSIQILMGLQVYLADFFGLHIEAGVGSPYFAEGGLTIRIKNKVKSAKPTFPMHAKD
ncbi:MAG TPA: hypothetical protein VNZ45_15170, partial [Bacteroidia bacterium]|nr:hypothetical protein [Bacteroidia bacterium]